MCLEREGMWMVYCCTLLKLSVILGSIALLIRLGKNCLAPFVPNEHCNGDMKLHAMTVLADVHMH